MENKPAVSRIVIELRDSLKLVRSMLESRSRLEFVIEQLEEIIETVNSLLGRQDLEEGEKNELLAIEKEAKTLSSEAISLIEMNERDQRNLKSRTRVWG
ncbi:MAG: hypothetical protein NZ920_04300 [Aigarchaeota archaeon]|nr:hypothetical protein [Aigarchaeota archaeon]MDW8092158.1 hypothetical protein [Nitrososphaerota archaeon]